MAQRVFQFTATIPAGTPPSSLAVIDLDLDNWVVESIDLEVPPGPAGLMGFYVANNGVAWMPQGTDEFLIWDDVIESWIFTDQPNASGWQVAGYNFDEANDHNVIVRFHVNVPVITAAGAPVITIIAQPASTIPVML